MFACGVIQIAQGRNKPVNADAIAEAPQDIAIRQGKPALAESGAASQILATSDDRLQGSRGVVLCGGLRDAH